MRFSLLATSLASLLVVSGCGTDPETSTEPTTSAAAAEEPAAETSAAETTTSAEEATETAEETTEETESTEPEDSGEAAFGERLEVSDNLAITISEPEEFTPSYPEMLMEEWDKFIKMDVVAENTGDEPLEAFSINARATSGSREAEAIFDTESGIDMPTAIIQPGRELEFTIGFGVVNGEPFDLTIEDMMDFTGQGVTISTTIE
ncbi:hypothetical protein ACI3ET_00065 [Ornithinimicrobium sp. LYQ121]|uniref:hypothetical protein n=1 Tax=Ornithinimicrobium sp. LYQ121 TaxID=3378801 RepID=UPI0038530B0F